jgi:hypothetical protein
MPATWIDQCIVASAMLLAACDSPADVFPERTFSGSVENVLDYPLEGFAGSVLVRHEAPDLFNVAHVIIHVQSGAPIRRATSGSAEELGFDALVPGTRATFRVSGYAFRSNPPQTVATRVDITGTASD